MRIIGGWFGLWRGVREGFQGFLIVDHEHICVEFLTIVDEIEIFVLPVIIL